MTIPATRLPFVNAEIAQVSLQGSPHLVSSVWAGSLGGRIYFWNPQTGHKLERELPHKIPGCYMLRTGPDGLLYLGCGDGSLLSYNGQTDSFEILSRGELDGISWGGEVVGRKVFWNASYKGKPGAVACYDLDQKKTVKIFAPVDPDANPAHYGHGAAATPDGRVIWGMNVPQARLAIFDPGSLSHEVITPDWLVGYSWVWVNFIDNRHLVVNATENYHGGKQLLLHWPSLKIVREMPAMPEPSHVYTRARVVAGVMYQLDAETGDLWGIEPLAGQWQRYETEMIPGGKCTLGVWNDKDLACVSVGGETAWRRAKGDIVNLDLEGTGVLGAHALCVVPELDLVVGAPFINQRFWTMRLSTGEGRDRGRAAPGGGQINQIIWDAKNSRALLSSYTSASICAFDPKKQGAWPINPSLVATAKPQGQMRPLALVQDADAVWMATSPNYGTLGGALCRLDLKSGNWQVWRHLVQDMKPTHLVPDPARHRLYMGFDITADCDSAPPSQTTGRVGVFDTKTCTLAASRIISENLPGAYPHALMPDGRALICQGPRFYTWEPTTDELIDKGEHPAGLTRVFNGPGDLLLVSTRSGLGVIHETPQGMVYTQKLDIPGTNYHHWVGDTLYCAAGTEVLVIPLKLLVS
jgi:hypothetical protein